MTATTKSTTTTVKSTTSPKMSFDSKSDWARWMLKSGKKVHEIEAISNNPVERKKFNWNVKWDRGMGYSFIFGVAKRSEIAGATGGRKVKAVEVNEKFVRVRCDSGEIVEVNRATGEVKKTK